MVTKKKKRSVKKVPSPGKKTGKLEKAPKPGKRSKRLKTDKNEGAVQNVKKHEQQPRGPKRGNTVKPKRKPQF